MCIHFSIELTLRLPSIHIKFDILFPVFYLVEVCSDFLFFFILGLPLFFTLTCRLISFFLKQDLLIVFRFLLSARYFLEGGMLLTNIFFIYLTD